MTLSIIIIFFFLPVLLILSKIYSKNKSYIDTYEKDKLTSFYKNVHIRDFVERTYQFNNNEENKLLSNIYVYFHINELTIINNEYGKEIANALISQVASRLLQKINVNQITFEFTRSDFILIDTNLYQSDEMALVLNTYKNIIQLLNLPYNINDQQLFISVKAGLNISPFYASPDHYLEFIQNAYKAMERTLHRGYDSIVLYNDSTNDIFQMSAKLANAMENDEFKIFFNPTVNIKTRKTESVEFIIRWENKTLGSLSQAVFMPIADSIGLSDKITEWHLNEIIIILKTWNTLDDFHNVKFISFNIGVTQLLNAFFIDKLIKSTIDNYISPSRINIQVKLNENSIDFGRVAECIDLLKKNHFKVTLDDFGIHHHVIMHIHKLNIDMIKIDQSIVEYLYMDSQQKVLFSSLIAIAAQKNVKLIANGVSNQKQFNFISKFPIQYYQGRYKSSSLNYEQLLKLINDDSLGSRIKKI